jgi:hypothetical protein
MQGCSQPQRKSAQAHDDQARTEAVIQAVRMRVERPLAWEDMFKRLLLRLERTQQRH